MDNFFPLKTKDFKIHIIDGTINNIYLMEYEDKAFIVDPGIAGDMKNVVLYMDENGIPISKLRFSFVSHMHPDHSGGAVSLYNKYKIPIAAHKFADRWYGGIKGWFQYILDSYMTVQVIKRRGAVLKKVLFGRCMDIFFKLEGGDLLPGFSDWEVLYMPGHTAHDLLLYNKSEKILYLADEIIEFKESFYLPLPVLFKKSIMESYRRLSFLDADTLLFAHGGPIFFCGDKSIYTYMLSIVNEPLSNLARTVRWLSCYSPEISRFRNGEYF